MGCSNKKEQAMRRNLFQLITSLFIYQLVAFSGTSWAAKTAQGNPDMAADSLAIRATLDEFYDAMYKVDATGILAPLTPQFLLLEGTLPLTGPELVAGLKEGGGVGPKWSAEFSDFRTRFHGDVAWTTLKNYETSFSKDGEKCKAEFLETIVFVRGIDRWLIDRYHAAVVHPWSCEE